MRTFYLSLACRQKPQSVVYCRVGMAGSCTRFAALCLFCSKQGSNRLEAASGKLPLTHLVYKQRSGQSASGHYEVRVPCRTGALLFVQLI